MAKDKLKYLDGLGRKAASTLQSQESATGPKGMHNQYMIEPVPNYAAAGSENIIQGNNNSFLVLGRDRPGHPGEGYGGQGATQCGMIDLVVGLDGANMRKPRKESEPEDPQNAIPRQTSPNFFLDAARVYITQRGDIDNYFGLAKGTGSDSKNRSAIGIKADHVRIVSRNDIKLVTGKARLRGAGSAGEKNSMGGGIEHAGKIDFIAGNYTDDEEIGLLSFLGDSLGDGDPVRKLQPLVKGDNLLSFVKELYSILDTMLDLISKNNYNILKINNALSLHVHETNVPFGPTSPPLTTAAMLVPVTADALKNVSTNIVTSFNMGINKLNYLEPIFPTYLNSRFVNTT